MKKYLVIITFLIFSRSANAQLSRDEVVRYLTNGSFRTWIYKDYQFTLGNTCSGEGQSFDFYNSGKLTWKKCLDGKPVSQEFNWSVSATIGNPGEYTIMFNRPITIIDGTENRSMQINLILPAVHSRNTKMSWNNPPGCKPCPEQIIEFLSKN